MKSANFFASLLASGLLLLLICILPSLAAPPVRIAIVPGGASGMEQEVVDRITDRLSGNPNIAISTVNPDWLAVVNISDKPDLMAQTIRVNGTLTIKTTDGHIVSTTSVQSNKQDFNLSPGTPAPMNKALVDSAAREVIANLTERAINPIQDAVQVEIDTREKIISAHNFADDDKYDDALKLLMTISPETPHFKGARALIAEYQMEADALDLMNQAKANVKSGKLRPALIQLKGISEKSKRRLAAKQMIASIQRSLAGHPHKTSTATASSGDQMKALDAQKKALDAQRRAIDAQETAIKLKSKQAK